MVGARTRDLRIISAQSATCSATMSKGVDPRRANGRYCLIFLTVVVVVVVVEVEVVVVVVVVVKERKKV